MFRVVPGFKKGVQLVLRFLFLLAPCRICSPSSGGMRRTNPPHLGRNLFRDRAGLHSLAHRLLQHHVAVRSRSRSKGKGMQAAYAGRAALPPSAFLVAHG